MASQSEVSLLSLFIYCHFNKPGEGFNYFKRVRAGWDWVPGSRGIQGEPNPSPGRRSERKMAPSRTEGRRSTVRAPLGTCSNALLLGAPDYCAAARRPCSPPGRTQPPSAAVRAGFVFVYPSPGRLRRPYRHRGIFCALFRGRVVFCWQLFVSEIVFFLSRRHGGVPAARECEHSSAPLGRAGAKL